MSCDKTRAEALVDFLNEAWTPFHAVEECKKLLLNAGFIELDEREAWQGKILREGRYFFTRNMSALIAFAVGGEYVPGNGVVVIAAHTDSPCPKLKPISKLSKSGYIALSLQPYGGGLWHTWFDRDLSVGGRALVNEDGKFILKPVKITRPILRTSTLAIHLTPADERAFQPNFQNHMPPILASEIKAALELNEKGNESKESEYSNISANSRHSTVLVNLIAEELKCDPIQILDLELQLCDTHPSTIGGVKQEFVFSGRLDNLCSSFQSITALIDSLNTPESLKNDTSIRMVCLFDNEEVGSQSTSGAMSTLTPDAIRRASLALLGQTSTKQVTETKQAEEVKQTENHNNQENKDKGKKKNKNRKNSNDCHTAESGTQCEESQNENKSNNQINQLNDVGTHDLYERTLQNSFLVSADMAHALHPNYSEKHDSQHQPMIHKGVVLKHNANQRYATNSLGASIFRECARRVNVPIQEFCVRADSGCGTTVGPILASLTGIKTVDVGCPQLSMHSIREVMGVDDVENGYLTYKSIFENYSTVQSLFF